MESGALNYAACGAEHKDTMDTKGTRSRACPTFASFVSFVFARAARNFKVVHIMAAFKPVKTAKKKIVFP
jgi:hypothetical protein